jgi:hypothetical protein
MKESSYVGCQSKTHLLDTRTHLTMSCTPITRGHGKSWRECVAQPTYFGTRVAKQNLILEVIKTRLNSDNVYSNSVQNILSSHLLTKLYEIIMTKTIILPVVLYGCGTWSLTLSGENRLSMSKNGMLITFESITIITVWGCVILTKYNYNKQIKDGNL